MDTCTLIPRPRSETRTLRGNTEVFLPWTGSILWLRTEMAGGHVDTEDKPYAQVSLERKLWLATAEDMTRLDTSAADEDGATCAICLDAMELQERYLPGTHGPQRIVMTACGHVFHATCCRQSEEMAVLSNTRWACPICRAEVTTAKCSYKAISLNQKPLRETTGAPLAQMLVEDRFKLREVVRRLLQLDVLGSRDVTATTIGTVVGDNSAEAAETLDTFEGVRNYAARWAPGVARSEIEIKLSTSPRTPFASPSSSRAGEESSTAAEVANRCFFRVGWMRRLAAKLRTTLGMSHDSDMRLWGDGGVRIRTFHEVSVDVSMSRQRVSRLRA